MKKKVTFAERKSPPGENEPKGKAWKILVVDDVLQIHKMTKIVLSDLVYLDRGVEILNAHSRKQAERIVPLHPDLALILLDVVMEEEDSGLRLVKYVREVLNNQLVRIIIRTGQPGQAPEKTIITNYDINDYKTKPELTSDNLYTAVISSLRTYQEMTTLDEHAKRLLKRNAELERDLKHVHEELMRITMPPEPDGSSIPMTVNHQIQKITRFVLTHIQEPIIQTTAAELLNMSPTVFSRFFKNQTGMTFVSFVNRVRIAKAANMLVSTDLNIKKIAQHCGYSNLSNFNRHFLDIKSSNPKKYRSLHKKEGFQKNIDSLVKP